MRPRLLYQFRLRNLKFTFPFAIRIQTNFQSKMFRLIVIVVVATVALVDNAASQQAYQTTGLTEHNNYRAKHGSPPLSMDDNLNSLAEQCAQYYLNKGTIDHSCPYKGDAGENLFMGQGGSWSDLNFAAQTGVQMWYDEVKDYDYNNPGFSGATGHFTQVVWKSSTQLGFGVATGDAGTYGVGLYSPPGNYEGEFPENVLPPQ